MNYAMKTSHNGHETELTTKMVKGFSHFFCSVCGTDLGMQPGTHNGVIHTPLGTGFPAYVNNEHGSRMVLLDSTQIDSLSARGFSACSNGYLLAEGDI